MAFLQTADWYIHHVPIKTSKTTFVITLSNFHKLW